MKLHRCAFYSSKLPLVSRRRKCKKSFWTKFFLGTESMHGLFAGVGFLSFLKGGCWIAFLNQQDHKPSYFKAPACHTDLMFSVILESPHSSILDCRTPKRQFQLQLGMVCITTNLHRIHCRPLERISTYRHTDRN